MAKAVWQGKTIAETSDDQIIHIEGNSYFPPESLDRQYVEVSDQQTTCFWKGEASYYDVAVGDQVNPAAAWYYPEPKAGAIERVGRDFTNYVAFWNGVEVS